MALFGLIPFKLRGHKASLIANIRLQGTRWDLRQVHNGYHPLFLSVKWK